MKFYASIQLSKVKCLDFHPTKPMAFLGLYNGTVLVYDTNTLTLIHCLNIGHVIRAICCTENLLITGDDSGTITIFDSNFYKTKACKVHSDFIRKITFHDQLIYSCGDDTMIIICDLNLQKICYLEGHKHFVMDILINNNYLYSVSLDNKLGIFNLKNKNKNFISCHTAGINTITQFKEYLVTGSDDPSIKLWSNNKQVSQLEMKGNVTKVYANKDLLCVCVENGDFLIYNEEMQNLEKINLNTKLWDIKILGSRIWLCTDEGIRIFELSKFKCGFITNDKLYYLEGDCINYARVPINCNWNNLMIKKSKLPFEPEKAFFSENGKILAILKKTNFSILNTLGFRLKVSGQCKDIAIGNSFYAVYDEIIQLFDYTKLVSTIDERPVRIEIKKEYLICYFKNETLVYKESLEMELKGARSVDFMEVINESDVINESGVINELEKDEELSEKGVINDQESDLNSDQESDLNSDQESDLNSDEESDVVSNDVDTNDVFNDVENNEVEKNDVENNEKNDEKINVDNNDEVNTTLAVVILTDQLEIRLPEKSYFIDKAVNSYFIYQNILFYLYNSMLYYTVIFNGKIHSIFICNVEGEVLGINEHGLITWDNSFKLIDIKIQQIIDCIKILNKQIKPTSDNPLLTQFFISINEYSKALLFCSDTFIKFDILLSLNKLQECKNIAFNKMMHKKLAEKFLQQKMYNEACDEFYLAEEYDSAYLLDSNRHVYGRLLSDLEVVRVYECNEMKEFFRNSEYEKLVEKFYD